MYDTSRYITARPSWHVIVWQPGLKWTCSWSGTAERQTVPSKYDGLGLKSSSGKAPQPLYIHTSPLHDSNNGVEKFSRVQSRLPECHPLFQTATVLSVVVESGPKMYRLIPDTTSPPRPAARLSVTSRSPAPPMPRGTGSH